MNGQRGSDLDRKNEPIIISLMERIESEGTSREAFKKAWKDRMLEQLNREPQGERRERMVEDFKAFDDLYDEHFGEKANLTESVGMTPEEKWKDHLHKETNAVAVYVIEGMGYDQFGDRVRVQLTRREIHELDVRTANGRALLEGVVQLNQKVITDHMAKTQHIDATQAYAYTQVVPVLKRGERDA